MFGRKKQSQQGDRSGNDFGLDTVWPLGPTADKDATVDIVFVHGLAGKKYETWMKDGVFWPRDLLARDVPHARIMTWGYDANALPFFDQAGRGSIADHCGKLIWDLSQERVQDYQKKRPIIFVAHSLGGLVVKDALFKSYRESVRDPTSADYDEEKAAIVSATKGIVFAGTPHRGADKAKWLITANGLASYIQGTDTTTLSKSLKRGSDVAERLQSEFRDIVQSFAIFSLYEKYGYPHIGIIVPKDSVLLGWQETEIQIDANHIEMVKFANATDNNYKTFRQIIQKIIRARIDERAVENVRTPPPRRSDDSQGPPTRGLLEYPRGSSDSTRSGLLTLGQQNMGHSSQQSSELSIEQSTSRGSGSPLAGLREAQVSDTDDVAKLVEKGKKYLRQEDRNDPKNLEAANENLMRAREILLSSRNPDPAALVGTLHEIINVRFEMSFNKEFRNRPEEKWKHLQAAQEYSRDAFEYARQTSNKGDVALVKLHQAIIAGREAEVLAKWNATPEDVRQRKDEAVEAISRSLVELQDSGRPTFDKHRSWAEPWMKRLKQT